MTGKVSQVCCREDLDRMSCQVIIWILESFEYCHVGISVIVENVPEEGCQLLNLDRWRSNVNIGGNGVCIIHAGSLYGYWAFLSFMVIWMPISIRGHFWNLEIPSPVVGKLGGLIPRVNPTVSTSAYVTNDPIEEELRLPVSMDPASIHFRHHKSAKCRLGIVSLRCLNLDEVICMKLTTSFCQFHLEWISFFFKSWKNWSLPPTENYIQVHNSMVCLGGTLLHPAAS